MELLPVITKKDNRQFINFPIKHYKKEKNWIRPIDKEIEMVFDLRHNKSFKHGNCKRWLLKDKGTVIGRIAVFVQRKPDVNKDIQISGGIGFFECINNQTAADLLFDVAKEWLVKKGATFMDGPINFGPRDKWWGLLTKGFELEPNYHCNYNYSYYRKLFENYGFQVYFEHYTFVKVISEPLHPKLHAKSNLVAKNSNYTLKQFKMNEFDRFTEDIIEVYNRAWVNHEDVNPISLEQGKILMRRLKAVIQEDIIWLAYYKGKPAAIFVNIPEVNQILKYVKGKLNLLGKLKFLWYKNKIKNNKVLGLIFGVAPEYQGEGVDGAVIIAFANYTRKHFPEYKIIEMQGIGDFNKKMIKVVKQVGGDVRKVHTTFRYLFDKNQVFERMKTMD